MLMRPIWHAVLGIFSVTNTMLLSQSTLQERGLVHHLKNFVIEREVDVFSVTTASKIVILE
ncbi:hypothetical protein KR51_00020640 [Rubidibacter lacunae KORDI 51-2]|uniref:Uncharacterized protein n=1 Tax=Rubidibacter lacunae KORDI 51-2 TaxID=582515 RepID=U5DKP6_9CHRO|nr:hypothetical protein KR51_00020640 [Rubidibacter lacunae KORDI 51-2]